MSATAARDLPVLQAPEASLAVYGKTFRWAARWLGPAAAGRTRSVYAFCRYADELADTVGGDEARRRLLELRGDLERRSGAEPIVRELLRTGADLRPLCTLVDGVLEDLDPVAHHSLDDLLAYAYRVAGTVGLTMCSVFGVEDSRAHPFAVDLGIAMQLTNVARDVLEDAERGRVYLPVELLGRRVSAQELVDGSGDARRRARRATLKLLRIAREYYRSADLGLGYLPWRARLAVLTASRCYEAIGTELRRDPDLPWSGRAFVSRWSKLRLTLRAVLDAVFDRRLRARGRPHGAHLHSAVSGWPGTHGEGSWSSAAT